MNHPWKSTDEKRTIGVQSIIHRDAEYASAGAAASMHVPYILSTVSSVSMEDIAKNTRIVKNGSSFTRAGMRI